MPVHLTEMYPGGGRFTYRMGYGDMVFCFFSSISYNLEGKGNWGKRFPILLLDLCDHGVVENQNLDKLQNELIIIEKELQAFSLSDAVYDIANPYVPIPWDVIPGEENNNLAQPWVTPRGATSYFTAFADQIANAKRDKSPLILIFSTETANRNTLWQRKPKGRDYWTKDKDPISQSHT